MKRLDKVAAAAGMSKRDYLTHLVSEMIDAWKG
jgi:hypothetical protein